MGLVITGIPDDPGAADSLDQFVTSPLSVSRLNEGESVTTFTPSRPGNGYEPFHRLQLKAIAAGAGLSYENVARDYHQGNFSSQRQSLLEEDREISPDIIHVLVPDLCEPIAAEVAECAALEGAIPLDEYLADPEQFTRATWKGQGRKWVDPLKQINAIKEKLELGLTTLTREANDLGEDIDELHAERMKELKQQLAQAEIKARIAEANARADAANQPPAPEVTDVA